METITNVEKARELSSMSMNDFSIKESNAAYNAALAMADWKDEQHKQEKQQWIDKAMKVICNGCAQKVECEFKNWKTCTTKDELIKSIEE